MSHSYFGAPFGHPTSRLDTLGTPGLDPSIPVPRTSLTHKNPTAPSSQVLSPVDTTGPSVTCQGPTERVTRRPTTTCPVTWRHRPEGVHTTAPHEKYVHALTGPTRLDGLPNPQSSPGGLRFQIETSKGSPA